MATPRRRALLIAAAVVLAAVVGAVPVAVFTSRDRTPPGPPPERPPWPEPVPATSVPAPDGSGDHIAVDPATERVARRSDAGRVRWDVLLGDHYRTNTAGLVTLPDGGLVVYRFRFNSDYGAALTRLDPATGGMVWQAHVLGRHVPHSEYYQQVEVAPVDGRVRVTVWGSGTFAGTGTVVEVLDAADGRRVERWRWGPGGDP